MPPKSNETAHWWNPITGKLGARVPDNGVGLLPGQGGLRARRIGGQGEEPRLIFGAGFVLGKNQANFLPRSQAVANQTRGSSPLRRTTSVQINRQFN